MILRGIYTVGVARSLCRRLLLDIVIVNCPLLWLCRPLLRNTPLKLPNSLKIAQKWPFRRLRSFRVTNFGTNRKPIYDFLLVINTNLPPILYPFVVIAFRMSKIAINYFATPLAFKSPDLRKTFSEYQWMAKVPNGEEKLPKILTG